MATQQALAGAMRWARGAVIALYAALAVLVHHEIAAIAVTSAPSATHAGYAMPGTVSSSADAMPSKSGTASVGPTRIRAHSGSSLASTQRLRQNGPACHHHVVTRITRTPTTSSPSSTRAAAQR